MNNKRNIPGKFMNFNNNWLNNIVVSMIVDSWFPVLI